MSTGLASLISLLESFKVPVISLCPAMRSENEYRQIKMDGPRSVMAFMMFVTGSRPVEMRECLLAQLF